ncbi:MAG: 5-dehydro-4-deoxy-D-glucuronate isomerase [Deltaproteobacteria bacterium]|nr:5-dehydro-4-deoxy-D-glucuronate isomerase [Deltaproteobacteria bacterium]
MKIQYLPDNVRYRSLSSEELRQAFLMDDLFVPGKVTLKMVDVDRQVLGAALPTTEPLPLLAPKEFRTTSFCAAREVGVINMGGAGQVRTAKEAFSVPHKGCVYLGRGTEDIVFESASTADPAAFFLVSFAAHTTFPSRAAAPEEARILSLGSQAQANKRRIHQFIHVDGIRSCQLVMGFTELEPGNVWNTMPPHTHERRCETYAYFDLPEAHRLLHIMGTPQDTRHLWVANRQAVVSPSWSMHSGVATHAYSFVWAMGGENQSFDDMDAVPIHNLR